VQARQQYSDKTDHPRAATSTRPSDKLDQRGPLHANAGRWMEQEAPKVPETDGVLPQADGLAVQGKRLWAGREKAKGRLDRIQRRDGRTTHWRLPGAEGMQPPSRQPLLTDSLTSIGALQMLWPCPMQAYGLFHEATATLWTTEGNVPANA
jgi:hypothetical protein